MDRHRIEIPVDAPAGSYVVRTGLYDATSTQRLSVVDAAGQPVDDGVRAGEITVGSR
jgi:hypothetical protein